QDEDLGALTDQVVDIGQLLLVAEVRVGIDVLAAAVLDGLLDVRLVVLCPARLLVVVPGRRARAVGRAAGRCRGGSARSGALARCGRARGRCGCATPAGARRAREDAAQRDRET